jgi:hypothetical protein
MLTAQDRVIVQDGLCAHCAVHVKRVHHRDFPELQAECGTVTEAVAHLADMLVKDREGARSGWHREAIDDAINDVNAYHEALDKAAQAHREICRCAPRALGRLEPSIPDCSPSA